MLAGTHGLNHPTHYVALPPVTLLRGKTGKHLAVAARRQPTPTVAASTTHALAEAPPASGGRTPFPLRPSSTAWAALPLPWSATPPLQLGTEWKHSGGASLSAVTSRCHHRRRRPSSTRLPNRGRSLVHRRFIQRPLAPATTEAHPPALQFVGAAMSLGPSTGARLPLLFASSAACRLLLAIPLRVPTREFEGVHSRLGPPPPAVVPGSGCSRRCAVARSRAVGPPPAATRCSDRNLLLRSAAAMAKTPLGPREAPALQGQDLDRRLSTREQPYSAVWR